MLSASSGRGVVNRSLTAQPTTRREKRSRIAARNNHPSMAGVRGAAKGPAPPPREPAAAHEPRHALATRALAAGAQLGMDAGTAIAPPALRVDRGHLHRQPAILPRPRRLRTRMPRVVAGARDPERPAQGRDGKDGLLG